MAVVDLARSAGVRIMAIYGQAHVDRTLKADRSPVTAADMAAHAVIAEGLGRLAPGIPIVSEEDLPHHAAAIIASAPLAWVVDPLDGTKDFLARTGEFTVNIALLAKGRPMLGCVYAPAKDDMYWATRGGGAHRSHGAGQSARLRTRPWPQGDAITALVSGLHLMNEAEHLERIFPGASIRSVGSSLKYATIAAGEADLALRFTPTSLWDTAAAQCVIEEAGGALLTFDGTPLRYTHGSLTNPPFLAVGDLQRDLAGLLRDVRPPQTW